MMLGILLGFVIPVGLLIYWILILTLISSIRFRKSTKDYKEEV